MDEDRNTESQYLLGVANAYNCEIDSNIKQSYHSVYVYIPSVFVYSLDLSLRPITPSISIPNYLNWYTNMFKSTHQSGFLSIMNSIGTKPRQIWECS